MNHRTKSLNHLLNILTRYSDDKHLLRLSDIQDHMQSEYDEYVTKRNVNDLIKGLKDLGYEISDFEDDGCYLMERQFEKGEVLLLCHAIHAASFIPSAQSDDLIEKLLDTLSIYQQDEYHDQVYMDNPVKTNNKLQPFYNLEIVSEAIAQKRKLSFIYLKYDHKKQLVPLTDEPYIVEPVYIICQDSGFYLVGKTDRYPDSFVHFRIERLKDLKMLEENIESFVQKSDPYEYSRSHPFMFTGDPENVILRCKDSIISQIVDLFGPKLNILPDEKGYFRIRIKTTGSGALSLAQRYLGSIEIIEPEYLREEFLHYLSQALGRYIE